LTSDILHSFLILISNMSFTSGPRFRRKSRLCTAATFYAYHARMGENLVQIDERTKNLSVCKDMSPGNYSCTRANVVKGIRLEHLKRNKSTRKVLTVYIIGSSESSSQSPVVC